MTTIAEIAQNLRVSAATVSRALNDKAGVSAAVRAQILAEAARLNFVANDAARSLATARTDMIAFAVYRSPTSAPLFVDPFHSQMLFGAEQELQQQHLLVTTLTDDHIAHPERWGVARGRADGVIAVGSLIPSRFIAALHARGLPSVLVATAAATASTDTVWSDDRDGARLIAEHLLGHGRQRVVVLTGPRDAITNRERCSGFADALRRARVKPLVTLRAAAPSYDAGYDLVQEALRCRPTAILATSDALAMGAIDAATSAGLSVPGDLAITGFEDIEDIGCDGCITAPLTTISLPKQHLGRIAARQLLRRIAQPDTPYQRVLVETSIMIRGSCGCRPAGRATGSETGQGAANNGSG